MIFVLYFIGFLTTSVAGLISPNVIGNLTKLTYEDAPWIVSLQMFANDFAFCGATLIHSENKTKHTNVYNFDETENDVECVGYFVTAASCVESVPKIIATLGNVNLESDKDLTDTPLTKLYITKHENWANTEPFENDIALVQAHFTKEVCAVPTLPFYPHNHDAINQTFLTQMSASIAGWGLLTDNGLLQKELHNTTIDIYTDQECAHKLGHEDYRPQSMLCAGGRLSNPLSYDTGGPLTCEYAVDDNLYKYLCGIISRGSPRVANTILPAIFTEVSHFANWIESKLN